MSDVMTNDELREVLARWDGWVECQCGRPMCYWHKDYGVELPDYPNDLNAVATLEAKLTPEQYARYKVKLAVICGDDFHEHKTHWTDDVTSAKAEQRCRALVQVLSLEPATQPADKVTCCPKCGNETLHVKITRCGDFNSEFGTAHWFEGDSKCSECDFEGFYSDQSV